VPAQRRLQGCGRRSQRLRVRKRGHRREGQVGLRRAPALEPRLCCPLPRPAHMRAIDAQDALLMLAPRSAALLRAAHAGGGPAADPGRCPCCRWARRWATA
jgi:hypothetical protein